MSVAVAEDPRERAAARSTLATCGGAHAVHDGFGDCVYLFLPLWQAELGLTLAQVGAAKSMSSIGLSVFQLPASFLAERIGERAVLAGGTLLLGLAYLGVAAASGVVALGAALLLLGIGAAVQHPLSSSLIARHASGPRLRVALSTYNFLGDVGKVVVPGLAALIVGLVGWRGAADALGVFGIATAITLFVLLRPSADRAAAAKAVNAAKASAQATNWLRFANLGAIAAIDSAARTATLTLLPFVLIAKGAEVSTVGLALSLVFAGGAAGKFACGLLAIRWGVIGTVIATEVATVAALLALDYLPLAATMLLLPFLGLALNGTSSVLYGSVPETVARDTLARAFGIFYTLSVGGSALAPFLFGYVSDHAGLHTALLVLAGAVLAILPLTLPLRWIHRSAVSSGA